MPACACNSASRSCAQGLKVGRRHLWESAVQLRRGRSFSASTQPQHHSRASVPAQNAYNTRSQLSDRDGTAGPRTQVPASDRVALSSSTPRPPLPPSVVRSYEVPLWDAMKFNGPAPEIINGRLAMLGIVAAAFNEATYSETVEQQIPHVLLRLVIMVAIVTYSSLVPILKGAKSEAFGIFTPRAEITNARAAMLGFAVLLLLEQKSAVPFF